MSSSTYYGGGKQDERRTLLIGAVMAIVIIAMLVIVVIRFLTPDERLLVLQRGSVTKVEEGDYVRITGVVRDFGFARGFDAETPGDTGGSNALEAITVTPADDDAGTSGVDVVALRNDGDREGDRVTIVAEVDEVFGRNFFTLVEG